MGYLLFEHMFFVAIGSCIVAYHATGGGTAFVAVEELGKFVDDGGVVADGASVVAYVFEQGGAVEGCHHVVGIDGEDEVEVFDGKVVFSHIGSEKSTVVVSDEILGFQFEGAVIVCHRFAVVVEVVMAEGAVDEVSCLFGVETDGFVEMLDGFAVLLVTHLDVCLGGVGGKVEFVHFEGLVDAGFCCGGVFSLKKDLCFEGIAVCLFCPPFDDDVGDAVGTVEAVCLNVAEGEVVPEGTEVGRHLGDDAVVVDGFGKAFHVDVGKSAQFVSVGEVGIALDGFGAVERGA